MLDILSTGDFLCSKTGKRENPERENLRRKKSFPKTENGKTQNGRNSQRKTVFQNGKTGKPRTGDSQRKKKSFPTRQNGKNTEWESRSGEKKFKTAKHKTRVSQWWGESSKRQNGKTQNGSLTVMGNSSKWQNSKTQFEPTSPREMSVRTSLAIPQEPIPMQYRQTIDRNDIHGAFCEFK